MAPIPFIVDAQKPHGIICRRGYNALFSSSESVFPSANKTALIVPLVSKWPLEHRSSGFH